MPPRPPEAELIQKRRLERGLSVREAARRASAYAKVSEGTWRRYESPGDHDRDATKVAAMAAALSISPAELLEAHRGDAGAELETLMTRVAGRPETGGVPQALDGDGWTSLMSEILASFADIDAGDYPAATKADLKAELMAALTREAAERRRHMRIVRDITTGTGT